MEERIQQQSREVLSIKFQAANDYVVAKEKKYGQFLARLEILKIELRTLSDKEVYDKANSMLDEALQGGYSTSLILEDIHRIQHGMPNFDRDAGQLERCCEELNRRVEAAYVRTSGNPPKALMIQYLESLLAGVYKYLEPVRELRQELISRLEIASPILETNSLPGDEFLREGSHWKVIFDGRTELFKDLDGMYLISILLHRKRLLFTGVYLSKLLDNYKISPDQKRSREEDFGGVGGYEIGGARDLGLDIDDEGIRRLNTRLRDIREDLEEARIEGNEEAALELENELETIERKMRTAVGLNGHGRLMSGPLKAANDRVRNNINRSLKHIQGIFPDLGIHLEKAITRRAREFFSYTPEKDRTWKV